MSARRRDTYLSHFLFSLRHDFPFVPLHDANKGGYDERQEDEEAQDSPAVFVLTQALCGQSCVWKGNARKNGLTRVSLMSRVCDAANTVANLQGGRGHKRALQNHMIRFPYGFFFSPTDVFCIFI